MLILTTVTQKTHVIVILAIFHNTVNESFVLCFWSIIKVEEYCVLYTDPQPLTSIFYPKLHMYERKMKLAFLWSSAHCRKFPFKCSIENTHKNYCYQGSRGSFMISHVIVIKVEGMQTVTTRLVSKGENRKYDINQKE